MASSKQTESEQEAYATEQGRSQPRYPHNVTALLKFPFLKEGEGLHPTWAMVITTALCMSH